MATVLVIEDEFGIAELFDAILTDEGHQVFMAANGRRGLEMLSKERPDLLFVDYMMPMLDGAGVLREIKADTALQGVPVVLMSSMPEEVVAERCSGYTAFLRKPFRVTQIIELTKKLLGARGTSIDHVNS